MFTIFIFVLLLFFSAVLSGSESSLFSLPEATQERFEKSKTRRAKWILEWLKKPNQTLAAILLGNLLVNTLLSWTGDSLIKTWFSGNEFQISLISLFGITLLILVFGEIIPKVIAIQFSEAWIQFWSFLLNLWFSVANLLAIPLANLTVWLNRFDSSNKPSENELVTAVHMAGQHGVLHDAEKNILKRSINFLHDTAYNAMQPISQVMIISHSDSFLKAKKLFLQEKKPIALVYHPKKDKVIGYLHVRDLVCGIYKKQRSLERKIKEMVFVPETMLLKDVLEQFTSQTKVEVAGVMDESGQLTGIITIKDVLSEIIGEWDEEYQNTDESESKLIQKIDKNNYRILGELEIDEFNEYFHTNLSTDDSETMSGFLIDELDGFPDKNKILIINDKFQFSSMKVSDYRIKYFKMSVLK